MLAWGGTAAALAGTSGCADAWSLEPKRSDGATSAGRGRQSPLLRRRVEDGLLPPLDERVSRQPAVRRWLQRPGVYGGTLHHAVTSRDDPAILSAVARMNLVEWDPRDPTRLVGGLAASYDVLHGGRTYVFHLRQGVRWSDGEPFTADDVLFTERHVYRNRELSSTYPWWLLSDGKRPHIRKIDDHTFSWSWDTPHGLLLRHLADPAARLREIRPAHYMEQFHAAFRDEGELRALAQDNGSDTWVEYFLQDRDQPWSNPKRPVLCAFRLTQAMGRDAEGKKKAGPPQAVLERNPYYWKVDPKGRQLPYVDRVVVRLLDSDEIATQAQHGRLDYQATHLPYQRASLLSAKAGSGGYEVLRWEADRPWVALHVNQTHATRAVRDVLRDLRFRKALSYAIDRDAINNEVLDGNGGVGQPCGLAADRYHEDGMGTHYLEHQPDLANRLLDRVGLRQRDAYGWRVRPDGVRMTLTIVANDWLPGVTDRTYALVREHWRRVGLHTVLRTPGEKHWRQEARSNRYEIVGHAVAGFNWDLEPQSYVPTSADCYWAPEFGRYWESGGSEGSEPTGIYADLLERYRKLSTTADRKKQLELGRGILRTHHERLFVLSAAVLPYQPVVRDRGLVNVRDRAVASQKLGGEEATAVEQVSFRAPHTR